MDAKEAIKARFMKEYSRRNFADITVKELCAATPVARTTFYSYFNNTDEVKEQIEDELIGGLLAVAENVSSGNFPDMDFTIFMDEIENHESLIRGDRYFPSVQLCRLFRGTAFFLSARSVSIEFRKCLYNQNHNELL